MPTVNHHEHPFLIADLIDPALVNVSSWLARVIGDRRYLRTLSSLTINTDVVYPNAHQHGTPRSLATVLRLLSASPRGLSVPQGQFAYFHSARNRDLGGHRDYLEETFLTDAFPR